MEGLRRLDEISLDIGFGCTVSNEAWPLAIELYTNGLQRDDLFAEGGYVATRLRQFFKKKGYRIEVVFSEGKRRMDCYGVNLRHFFKDEVVV
ncbi:hypothetical protein HN935_01070 [archaeon]|jgi:hypothetical protein|nr:hypothetical protein [archaeon]